MARLNNKLGNGTKVKILNPDIMESLPKNLFSETFAILRPNEEENQHSKHNTLYHFHYSENDDFYIFSDGQWHEDVSTAYNFLQIPENPDKHLLL